MRGVEGVNFQREIGNSWKRMLLTWMIMGSLVAAAASSVIGVIACDQVSSLPGSASELSLSCRFPKNRTWNVSVGGLEPIPKRRIHAFEVFSADSDGEDVHMQIWWESTGGRLRYPRDLQPIIRFGNSH